MKITTKTTIADLKFTNPDKRDEIFKDDDQPNFGIRLRGNTASWIVYSKIKSTGRQWKESLGDIQKISLDAARKIARNRLAEIEMGSDPGAKKEKLVTFGEVARQYITIKNGVVRSSTLQTITRALWFFRPFENKALASIRRADIAIRLHQITAEATKSTRGNNSAIDPKLAGRGAAYNARKYLSALFTWAIGEGMVDTNPVDGTNNPGADLRSRSRVLSDNELGRIWRACPDNDFGLIIKLLILTGCRRTEIVDLEWSELNLADGIIDIPRERIKTDQRLVLPLPPLAIEVLRQVKDRSGRKFVFGSGVSPIQCSHTHLPLLRERALEGNTMDHWTLHDLRRTMRTGMSKLGIAPHIAERVINHKQRGIEAIYDQYKYDREIKTALLIWADHIASIIDRKKSNVVPLRA